MFARGGNLGFAFEKLLVAPQRLKSGRIPPTPAKYYPKFQKFGSAKNYPNLKNLDRIEK